MKKITKRRILSSVLALAVGFSTVGFAGTSVDVYAEQGATGERTASDSKTWFDKDTYDMYRNGMIDYTNGETVLRSSEKVNVLNNVMLNDENFDILEIVPYDLVSMFNVLVPQEGDEEKIAQYAEQVYGAYYSSNTSIPDSFSIKATDTRGNLAFSLTDQNAFNDLAIDFTKSAQTNPEKMLSSAETIAELAAMTTSPSEEANKDEALNLINNALTSAGTGVTASWKDSLAGTLTLSAGTGDSAVTKDINVEVKAYDVTIVDDILDYIDNSIKLGIAVNKPNDGNLYSSINKYMTDAYNYLNTQYGVSYNACQLDSYSIDMSDKSQYKYSFSFSLKNWYPAENHVREESAFAVNVGSNLDYSYSASMENYYLDNLFRDLLASLDPNSKKYEKISTIKNYFADGHVRVHTVVAGQLDQSCFEYPYDSDGDGHNDKVDKVDMIYITQPTKARAVVYRNAFFHRDLNIDPANPDDLTKVKEFFANSSHVDELFHTGVYKPDKTTEFTVSELISDSEKFVGGYGKAYVKDSSGNFVSNDISWDQAKMIMEYVFNSGNDALIGPDIATGEDKLFRVPVMFEMGDFSDGRTYYNTNMAKLYYMLCKTTDEPGTYAVDENIHTYYGDSKYFLNEYSNYVNETDPIWFGYNYEFNHDPMCDVWSSNSNDNTGSKMFNSGIGPGDNVYDEISAAMSAGKNPYVLRNNLYYWLTIQRKDDWTHNQYNIYNGMVGINSGHRGGQYPPMISDMGDGIGDPDAAGLYRLGTDIDSFFGINDYLLGLDASNFLVPPYVKFDYAQQGADDSVKVEAQRASERRARLKVNPEFDKSAMPGFDFGYRADYADMIYNLKESIGAPVRIFFHGDLQDEAGEIITGQCKLYGLWGTEKRELDGHLSYTYDGSKPMKVNGYVDLVAGTDEYEAYQNNTLSLLFEVGSKVEISDKDSTRVYNVLGTSTLKFVERSLHDLD